MSGKQLKEKLTENDIVTILKLLGAKTFTSSTSHTQGGEAIITQTVCHHGNSSKLYYYIDSKMFHCYTDCGDSFDVIELVRRSKRYERPSKAIDWITTQLGIDRYSYGFSNEAPSNDLINDWDFINNYIDRKHRTKSQIILPKIDEKELNIYQDLYCYDWVQEGISIESMQRYEIKYSTLNQKIIIPHRDIEGNLIGIRARAMIEEEVERYGKYAPMMNLKGEMYAHPLSQNLYGLHKNKEAIKRLKKVMLVESEKGVLQTDTMFGDNNFTLALCGNTLSERQKDILLELGVEEVIIGLDRQYKKVDDIDYVKWAKHIRQRIINKLAPYVRVYILWDTEDVLGYKDSPTDKGKEKLLYLMRNKMYAETI